MQLDLLKMCFVSQGETMEGALLMGISIWPVCLNVGSPVLFLIFLNFHLLLAVISGYNLVLHTESKSSCQYKVNLRNSAFEVVFEEEGADKWAASAALSIMKLLSPVSTPIKQVHASK